MERTYTHLERPERKFIMHHWERGESIRAIARVLKRAPSTISREIRRYREPWGYEAYKAEYRAKQNRHKSKRLRKIDRLPELRTVVFQGLARGWSPQQICGRIIKNSLKADKMSISHESIYAYIYAMPRGELRKSLIASLRRKHPNRRKQGRAHNADRGRIADMVSIHDRPETIEGRQVPGHWEGDLIVGSKNQSAVGTLVERTSRYLILSFLDENRHSAQNTRLSFTRNLKDVPKPLLKSLTYDQGKEMSQHKILAKELKIDVYFCDPHSPWQRGTNENTNGLVREYLPKGTDLSGVSQCELDEFAERINTRPRKTLNFATPKEVYCDMLKNITQSDGVALNV
jgi:IS30 family transposase